MKNKILLPLAIICFSLNAFPGDRGGNSENDIHKTGLIGQIVLSSRYTHIPNECYLEYVSPIEGAANLEATCSILKVKKDITIDQKHYAKDCCPKAAPKKEIINTTIGTIQDA